MIYLILFCSWKLVSIWLPLYQYHNNNNIILSSTRDVPKVMLPIYFRSNHTFREHDISQIEQVFIKQTVNVNKTILLKLDWVKRILDNGICL